MTRRPLLDRAGGWNHNHTHYLLHAVLAAAGIAGFWYLVSSLVWQ